MSRHKLVHLSGRIAKETITFQWKEKLIKPFVDFRMGVFPKTTKCLTQYSFKHLGLTN